MATEAPTGGGGEMGVIPSAGRRGNMGDIEYEVYQQVELMTDEEHDTPETKKKKRMARAALTMWNEQVQKLEQRQWQRGTAMNSVMNEVYQLVSLYSVFAGVLLTAVATSSRLECQHLWSPIGLCLFVYCMLIVVALAKFRTIFRVRTTLVVESQARMAIEKSIVIMRRLGYDRFDYTRHLSEVRGQDSHPRHWIYSVIKIVVPLTLFTAGLVFSFVHILCWS